MNLSVFTPNSEAIKFVAVWKSVSVPNFGFSQSELCLEITFVICCEARNLFQLPVALKFLALATVSEANSG